MDNPYYVSLVFWSTLIISGMAAIFLAYVFCGHEKSDKEHKVKVETGTEEQIKKALHDKSASVILFVFYAPVLWLFLYNLINFSIYEVVK